METAEKKDIPIVLIVNLKRSEDRRKAMAEKMEALGLEYKFIEAVDGNEFGLENLHKECNLLKRRLFFGREMLKGEMATIISHRKAYEYMVANDIEKSLVMEDDAVFAPEFVDVVRSILKLPLEWEMVRFIQGDKVAKYSRKIVDLDCKPYNLRRLKLPLGDGHTSLITLNGARKLIKSAQNNFVPIDIMHGYVWKNGLDILTVNPTPAWQDMSFETTVPANRFDKTHQLKGWEALVYPVTRAWFKLSNNILTNWVYIKLWFKDFLLKRKLQKLGYRTKGEEK